MASVIIDEMRALANGPWDSMQKAWYQKRLEDAKPVNCVKMREALTAEQRAILKMGGYSARKHLCYKNATELVFLASTCRGLLPKMKYVEGMVYSNGLFPIEHAWVRVGDKYIDPTFERVLHRDPSASEYVALLEMDWPELCVILAETKIYGEIYRHEYIKRLQAAKKANTGK